ncbi:MAG: hypothetical protein EOP50_18025, partial [Sphingobacteriales bacterium]
MNIAARLITLLVLGLSFSTPSHAQVISRDVSVKLKYATVTPIPNASLALDSFFSLAQKGPVQVLLQFNELPDAQRQQSLRATGIHLKDYVGGQAYIALMTPAYAAPDAGRLRLRSILAFKPEWKLDPRVGSNTSSTALATVLVSFYKGEAALAE